MENIIRKKISFIYYIAIALSILLRLLTSTTLININLLSRYIILAVILFLFIIKIILDKHSFKYYMSFIVAGLLVLYIYIITKESFILILFFSFFSIQNVDIKKVIKIDFIIKFIFLFSHLLLFLINKIFYISTLENIKFISSKGIAYSVYFMNPNTFCLLTLWLIFDVFYLKGKIKFKDIVLGLIIILFSYVIAKSRTSLYIYFIFILINLMKNEKIINFLFKYTYIIVSFITYFMVKYIKLDSSLFVFLNDLTSNRIGYSIKAINLVNYHLFPNFLDITFYNSFIIDNFYIKCFINYGIITLIILYIPHLIIKNKTALLEMKYSILSNIYLFFEASVCNIGFSPIYLILADIIFNKGELIERKKENEN